MYFNGICPLKLVITLKLQQESHKYEAHSVTSQIGDMRLRSCKLSSTDELQRKLVL